MRTRPIETVNYSQKKYKLAFEPIKKVNLI